MAADGSEQTSTPQTLRRVRAPGTGVVGPANEWPRSNAAAFACDSQRHAKEQPEGVHPSSFRPPSVLLPAAIRRHPSYM